MREIVARFVHRPVAEAACITMNAGASDAERYEVIHLS
jgi:hypothetical protein